jgi:hypothetical protein
MKQHHAVMFDGFEPWRGTLPSAESETLVDFLGFRIPRSLYCNKAYMSQKKAHAIRVRQCLVYPQLHASCLGGGNCMVQASWPVVAEEYFEYADVLGAALDYAKDVRGLVGSKPRPFSFVELGAGYGHWTFAAHTSLAQLLPGGFDHNYLMVDVVGALGQPIMKLAALNGVEVNGTARSLRFHVGYVSSEDSAAAVGESAAQRRDAKKQVQDYAHLWGTGASAEDVVAAGATVSLRTLFDMHSLPSCVDMVDIDIHGGEYARSRGRKGLFYSDAAIKLLSQRARRVHIGLHFDAKDEVQELVRQFQSNRWRIVWLFEKTTSGPAATPFGPVDFGDGALSVVNENKGTACG